MPSYQPNDSSSSSEQIYPTSRSLVPLLTRKASAILQRPTEIKAPPLTPVAMEPQRFSNAALPLKFLESIDRIEIHDTVVRDGVTYYVLEIYLLHYNSRLPTSLRRARTEANQRTTITQEPDFKIERRFSEFAAMRYQVLDWSCINSQFLCDYCNEFLIYIRFKWHQPRLWTKFTTNVETRKKLLASFLMDFIALAQNRHLCNHKCETRENVPSMLESFVRS